MNPFEMVVLIVLIVTIGRVLQVRASRRSETPPAAIAEVDQLTQEVARLRERVSVLERVITDKRQRLADEIEDLRS